MPGERLRLLDALRGIASLSVAWFHFYVFSNIGTQLSKSFPSWLDTAFRHGSYGVPVFFVLSGIVIPLSLNDKNLDFGNFCRFVLKRSIRLDLPYWSVLILASALLLLSHQPLGLLQFAAHVVYLQGILGYKEIVSQFWSLCFEFQFYLFFASLLWIEQNSAPLIRWTSVLLPLAASLWLTLWPVPQMHGVFVTLWIQFYLGTLTTYFMVGKLPFKYWLGAQLLIMAFSIYAQSAPTLVACLAALAIGAAAIFGKLTLNCGAILQWLGKLSYSIYLTHFIGSTMCKHLDAYTSSTLGAIAVMALATGVTLGIAWVFYYFIEHPAHRLAQRVDYQKSTGT